MKMHTYIMNSMRDINDFVNDHAIQQESIVSIFPSGDGTFTLVYFSED